MNTDHSAHKFFESLRNSRIKRRESQWLGGVAAGLAERYQVDTVLVRGIAVALSLFGGIGMIAYGLAWAFLPDEKGQIHFEEALQKNWTTGMTGALTVFLLGVGPAPWVFSSLAPFIWPLLLIAAVLFIVFSRKNTKFASGPKKPAAGFGPEGSPTTGQAAKTSADYGYTTGDDYTATTPLKPFTPEPVTEDPSKDSGSEDFRATAASWEPSAQRGATTHFQDKEYGMNGEPDDHYGASAAQHKSPKTPEAPPVPGWVATIVVGVTALIVAIIFCADYFDLFTFPGGSWSLALSLGLLFVGVVLVIAALTHRTSGGLLGLAIPLLVLSLVFGNTGFNDSTGFGVQSGGEIQQNSDGEYNAIFSNATVDLRHYANLSTPVEVEVNTVFASVELLLPAGVPVQIESNGVFLSQQGDQPQGPGGDNATPAIFVEVNGVFSRVLSTQDQAAIPSNSSDF